MMYMNMMKSKQQRNRKHENIQNQKGTNISCNLKILTCTQAELSHKQKRVSIFKLVCLIWTQSSFFFFSIFLLFVFKETQHYSEFKALQSTD